jgi:hypothetical protein
MKVLAYLLGSQALDVATASQPAAGRSPEPDLPPIASTPETAKAWREWAHSTPAEPPAPASGRTVLPLGASGTTR